MGDLGVKLLQVASVSTVITLMAALGAQPGYNFPLALFGMLVPHLQSPYLATALCLLVGITMIFDIIWCSMYGPDYSSGALLFGLIMTCFNLFLKALWGYYAFEYMTAQGGDPLMLLQPSEPMSNSGHEEIVT